ncbi:helix-turn-helix domain-containing protein [Actinoplanes awajinensis]|uniref:helix-turn-helix domain-containing protein n=1 Tax=Actinoplanes awajinensis TaxID=135946 RepID=UPI000A6E15C4|nr:helix-turn-helix domain-containing protein [Actinoplanes awajinensis]
MNDRRTRTPTNRPDPIEAPPRRTWDIGEIRALGATTDLLTAGEILGISRNSTYRLARSGAFPVPVIHVGKQYRVAVAGLLVLLQLDAQTPLVEPADAAGLNALDAADPGPAPKRSDTPTT